MRSPQTAQADRKWRRQQEKKRNDINHIGRRRFIIDAKWDHDRSRSQRQQIQRDILREET